MMIAVAIAGSLVVYAWVMGYISLSTEKSGQAILIQGIFNDGGDLLVYVQNVGEGTVQLDENECLYIDGLLAECVISNVAVSGDVASLNEGETATLRCNGWAVPPGERVKIKVTTTQGTPSEIYDYPAGTAYAPVLDHFEFEDIPSPQTSGVPFTITVRAVDQCDYLFRGYNGTNTLTYSDGEISPPVTGDFVGGVWNGEITVTGSATTATTTTVAQTNMSWTGTSNTFNVSGVTILWNKTYGGTAAERAFSVVATSDGGYALVGTTDSFGAGEDDFWLVKTDASGNMEWNKTYGGTGDDQAWSLVETSDGGYIIAGSTDSFGAGGYDFWLIKTDEYGNTK